MLIPSITANETESTNTLTFLNATSATADRFAGKFSGMLDYNGVTNHISSELTDADYAKLWSEDAILVSQSFTSANQGRIDWSFRLDDFNITSISSLTLSVKCKHTIGSASWGIYDHNAGAWEVLDNTIDSTLTTYQTMITYNIGHYVDGSKWVDCRIFALAASSPTVSVDYVQAVIIEI